MSYAKIAVFVTQQEYDANGYAAQDLFCKELRERLNNTNIDYNVVEAADTPDMSTQEVCCCDNGVLEEWRGLVSNCLVDPCSADSHLLITNSSYYDGDVGISGCADNPGTSAVTEGGPELAEVSALARYGTSFNHMAFNVACQELFHNFSVDHKHGDLNRVSSLSGWYISPMMTGHQDEFCDGYNACGSYVHCYSKDGYDTQWTVCAEDEAEAYLA